ncbi:hypothetical protein PoB_006882100 [Plakobranchus ocellatus]|uniref:Uncharacterized protein n=1 Tax=Plakobranchus ocellatus TaxID=259542 RepID=A0AAV4DEQ7_9GAST|nr:hypothetical protein PoB_006882100 [Plakobranchus ocellatus]
MERIWRTCFMILRPISGPKEELRPSPVDIVALVSVSLLLVICSIDDNPSWAKGDLERRNQRQERKSPGEYCPVKFCCGKDRYLVLIGMSRFAEKLGCLCTGSFPVGTILFGDTVVHRRLLHIRCL